MEKKIANLSALLIINGIIALLFGVFALFVPQETAKSIAVYFGFILLLGGLIGMYVSIKNMQQGKNWLFNVFGSLLGILVGIFIVIYTRRSIEIFAIIMGIWAIILGAVQLILFFNLQKNADNKRWFLFSSILPIVFGLILFFNPFESIVAILVIVGILALIFGFVLVYLGLAVRKDKD
ncbi:MAG TPA: DUF308 domain-containing protein [Bacteroidales bacterium]|nr:DUF308 domain-containing protein [Bacteroidales bacterium]HPR57091.1 DUF308 domain-containing protein [Bacteroidales bacterium]HRW96551.1 DUF308 domain-containing protein [Bacteroidales bacterium]